MSAYLPVPCPRCNGLVRRDTVKCVSCGCQWPTAEEMEWDGAVETMGRACQIVELVGVTQEAWDAIALERRYVKEAEKKR